MKRCPLRQIHIANTSTNLSWWGGGGWDEEGSQRVKLPRVAVCKENFVVVVLKIIPVCLFVNWLRVYQVGGWVETLLIEWLQGSTAGVGSQPLYCCWLVAPWPLKPTARACNKRINWYISYSDAYLENLLIKGFSHMALKKRHLFV